MEVVGAGGDDAADDSDSADDSDYSTPEEQSANAESSQRGFDSDMKEVDPKDGSDNRCPEDDGNDGGNFY